MAACEITTELQALGRFPAGAAHPKRHRMTGCNLHAEEDALKGFRWMHNVPKHIARRVLTARAKAPAGAPCIMNKREECEQAGDHPRN